MGDYDPHANRSPANPTSFAETVIHFLKGALGTGILAMPEAFKNAGIWYGTIASFCVGFIITLCMHVLLADMYEICKRQRVPYISYAQSMKIALQEGPPCLKVFTNAAPHIINIFLIINQMGICSVYVIFVASNIKSLSEEFSETRLDLKIHILIWLVPHMLVCCIRSLKMLAPMSLLSNLISFITFGMVLSFVFKDMGSLSEVPALQTWISFPLFFGTILFALESVGVVLSIEENMANPASFTSKFGVLNICMFVLTVLYVGMGFFGYWKYKEETLPSITLNVTKNRLANAIKGLYALAIFFSYALQGFVPVQILWDEYLFKHVETSEHILRWEYLLRMLNVITTVLLAAVVPYLGLFISLVGAFCLSAVGIIFPAIMDISIRYPDRSYGFLFWRWFLDLFFILFGLLGLGAGTFSSIKEITDAFGRDYGKK